MTNTTSLRRTALALLVVLLMAAPSWAGSWQQVTSETLMTAWSWLGGAVQASSAPARGHRAGKQGCGIDPAGNPSCPPASKQGCGIDPNGSTTCPPITLKHGCGIDPNGNTVCTP